MCGGRGTRLDADREKPLFRVDGVPMVERVCAALRESRIETTYAVVSPEAPETAAAVDAPTVETPGEGYVADLDRALADDRIERPILTVAADLPLLDGAAVDRVLDVHAGGSLTVAVPVERKREVGVSADTSYRVDGRDVAPAGINVVGRGPDETWVTTDERFAVNVNRRGDAAVAERLLVEG